MKDDPQRGERQLAGPAGSRGAPRDISTLSFTHLCTFPPIYVLILVVCSLLHPYLHLLCGHTCISQAGAIHLTAHFHRLCTFPSLFQSFKCLFFVLLAGYYPNRWRPLIDEAPTVSGKHRLLPEGKHQLLPENTNCHRGTTDSYRTTPTATGKHKVSLGKQQPKCCRGINGYREIPTGEHKLLPENTNCCWGM